MPNPSPRVAVAAVALVDDLEHPSRLLAARRTEPPSLAGGWEFPGGKVEPPESAEDAAVREVLEELGVRVRLGSRVGRTWPLGSTYEMHLFWGVALEGEPEPQPVEDHDAVRWLGAAELFEVAWLPADLPIVRYVETRLRVRTCQE
ncbi:(deoxy)nucleoside triphosphate pyrophosphohydrolase [Ornithinimicrobium cerasi]|uniref:(deoxy)nucleoside triphosphate pyrophosphohydrolase n=1 Tax=Ornithinimicrobium cerasi TaxID=2248773 RepID=UPI000F00965D|nr:NUDIX domain-containing protein [Ornithinimicrobium cerasi]